MANRMDVCNASQPARLTKPANRKSRHKCTANELIANIAEIKKIQQEDASSTAYIRPKNHELEQESEKVFREFKTKDIVFLAMMAAAMLVTGAIMPLVGQIPLFGIIQLCLGLQFSIFPVVGMMKVRKPGALMLISLFCGSLMLFMNTVMFFCMLLCAFAAEAITLAVFRSYDNNWASVLAGTVYFPLTLPFLYVWYRFIYTWTGEEGQAVNAFIGSSSTVAIAISFAVVALSFAGALIGMVISKELKKSGVMKK